MEERGKIQNERERIWFPRCCLRETGESSPTKACRTKSGTVEKERASEKERDAFSVSLLVGWETAEIESRTLMLRTSPEGEAAWVWQPKAGRAQISVS